MKRLILMGGLLLAVAAMAAGTYTFSSKDGAQADASTKMIDYQVAYKGPASLISVFGYNSGAKQFVLLIDTNNVPVNGAIALHTMTAGAADNFSCIVPVTGMAFSRGIAIAVSSTAGYLTLGSKEITCYGTFEVK